MRHAAAGQRPIRRILVVLALAGCESPDGVVGDSEPALILGVTNLSATPTFNLLAAPATLRDRDGETMPMWLYGIRNDKSQYPGPTLIVSEGARVTVNLMSWLPAATSIVFPGLEVTATGGAPGPTTREVPPGSGALVSYSFIAPSPGAYVYHSGTRPELQVKKGLAGSILVRPGRFGSAD